MTASLKTLIWHPPLFSTIEVFSALQYVKKGGGAMLRPHSAQE
jgi:hypothetical protein